MSFTTYKVVDAYFSLAFVSPKAITDRPKTLWKKLALDPPPSLSSQKLNAYTRALAAAPRHTPLRPLRDLPVVQGVRF